MSKGQYRVAYIATAAFLAGAMLFHGRAGIAAEVATQSVQESAVSAGSLALQHGDFDAAVTHFTTALDGERLPRETIAVTYLNRGLAYQRLGQLVEAIGDYDYALQQNVLTPPTRAIALYNRGLANRRLYRTTLALEDFTNALILNPRFPHAYNSRGNVLRELGYYSTAVEDYDAAIRYEHPQIHIPLYGKALAHAALGDANTAKRALAAALGASPNYGPAQILLARLTSTPQPQGAETVIADGAGDLQTGTVTASAQTEIARTPAPFSGPATVDESRTAQLPGDDVVATPAGGPHTQRTATNATSGQTQVFVPGPGFEDALGREDSLGANRTETADPATVASATPQAAAETAIPHGYMIQLSAQRDRDAARDVWTRITEGNGDLLADLTLYIIEADLGTRGIFYRTRAGVSSRDEGERLCRELKSRRVECFVVSSGS
jgi:tetratricopeptide (TPR) repeat protein